MSLTPATLLEAIADLNPTPAALCDYFQISRSHLDRLLDSPRLQDELNLQLRLDALHAQLTGLRHAPAARRITVDLMQSNKPEVARRSTQSVMSWAVSAASTTAANPSTKSASKSSAAADPETAAFNKFRHIYRDHFIREAAIMKDPSFFRPPAEPFTPFELDDPTDPQPRLT